MPGLQPAFRLNRGIASRLLKKSANPSCSFGLLGLSGLFGYMRPPRWTRQTGLISDVQAIEILLCRNGFSATYGTTHISTSSSVYGLGTGLLPARADPDHGRKFDVG